MSLADERRAEQSTADYPDPFQRRRLLAAEEGIDLKVEPVGMPVMNRSYLSIHLCIIVYRQGMII
jgi:hypothetical protein